MRDQAVWLLRALWFVLPVTAGAAISDALANEPDGTRLAITIGAWVLWAVGLACTAILLPLTLTGIRMLAPAAAVATLWAVTDESGALGLVGLAISCGAALVAFSSLVGDRMVDGASYGDERRMLLRPPTRLALSAVPFAWAIAVAGITAGPLLLATERWIPGVILTALGLPLTGLAARALHQLSRRWIVFVPTGFVLHDLNVLTEPVLFRRTAVERLGPAIDGTPAKDLSNRAAGLLIECELTDAAPLGLRTLDRSATSAEMLDVRRFLFTPTLPGELLNEAERRNLPVG